MSTVLEEYHLELQLVLILVLFSLILIFCLEKKNFFFQCFILIFHLIVDFQSLLPLISQMAFLIFKMR